MKLVNRLSFVSGTNLILSLMVIAALILGASWSQAEQPNSDPLRRRAFLGVQIGPLSPEERDKLKLPPAAGLSVQKIVPGSSAELSGLKTGDVIVAVNDEPVGVTAKFVQGLGKFKGGDTIAMEILREGKASKLQVRLKETPRETNKNYQVKYGSVASKAGRIRTLVTYPQEIADDTTKRPALILIQGIGQFTMERVFGGFEAYDAIVDDFNGRGYITLRVDKPGCGDSEGGPTQDIDFETQLDAFRQALKALKEDPKVDSDRILIFGHSMGGVWGPLLASETPIRGIAVYGTVAKPWNVYALENSRRQKKLAGLPDDVIEDEIKAEEAANKLIYEKSMSPSEVAKKHPELADWIQSHWTMNKYYSGCTDEFFRQIANRDLAKVWKNYPGHVLAVWGKADFVASKGDHEHIIQIMKASQRPNQTSQFLALENSDHGFYTASDESESFRRHSEPGVKAVFNPSIVKVLRDWSDSIVK